ncbi:MAG TPA: TlpA disulfide reductase family protein [Steroidobacteraceae bacterium]|nr:TlpA disulfide reductase family protein [Steroidobacteraceae bacterium]
MPRAFWLAVPVVLIGAGSGFIAYRQLHKAPQSVATASPPPAAQPAPTPTPAANEPDPTEVPAPAPRPPVPETVPEVQLQDLNGAIHALAQYTSGGHPTIINFWATWCAPCLREIPLLNQLQQSYSGDKLQVVGIAVDFRDSVREYLKHTQINYVLLIGEQDGLEAAAKFGMDLVLPFSVFADGQGRIVAVKVGELHQAEADYILAAMRRLKRGGANLVETRQAIADRLRQLAAERARAEAKSS